MAKSCQLLLAALLVSLCGAQNPKASELAAALGHLSLDPAATYRVRDLELHRGDAKLFFTEGVLSFFTPVGGHVTGALFTAENIENGDAEVLVLPPARSERMSLSSFTGRPNLDEHLRAGILFFADETAAELRREIESHDPKPAPDLVEQLNTQFGSMSRALSGGIDLRVLQSLLDRHAPEDGFFYAALFGRTLPSFAVFYDPLVLEPVTVGQGATAGTPGNNFQVWATFRPRRAATFVPPANRFANYRIETTIRPDLTMQSKAEFDYRTEPDDGRAIRFEISERLRVLDATVDGQAAEVFQRASIASADPNGGGAFLVVSAAPLSPGVHRIAVRYGGGVIRQTTSGNFFVDDRTSWFPYSPSLQSTFDLTFRCPERLQLVSTGELISEDVANGVRTVRRRSSQPRPFAGFNLGRYSLRTHSGSHYNVEVYSDQAAGTPATDIPQQTDRILEFYTKLWGVQPLRTLAVSPIDGYFGQGFPGLVYLSDAAYVPPENRAAALRNERLDTFLNRLLLPHEIAHQWWGNLITSSTYRSGWLVEALANYSALQYIEAASGREAARSVLAQYRKDLLAGTGETVVEDTGPLDWGSRLLNTRNPAAWQPIVYGKGIWVLEMLRQHLGDSAFLEFERQMLTTFKDRTFTNEDVAQLLIKVQPPSRTGGKTPDMQQFFETWIYNTGIPALSLRRDGRDWLLNVDRVDDSFSIDVPVRCGRTTFSVRANKGENFLPKAARSAAACTLPDTGTFLYRN